MFHHLQPQNLTRLPKDVTQGKISAKLYILVNLVVELMAVVNSLVKLIVLVNLLLELIRLGELMILVNLLV